MLTHSQHLDHANPGLVGQSQQDGNHVDWPVARCPSGLVRDYVGGKQRGAEGGLVSLPRTAQGQIYSNGRR